MRNFFQEIPTSKLRNVSKAYLITGGTPESRKEKYRQLIRDDVFLMYGDYEDGNELAVVFSANHDDFKGMTFSEAKKLAASAELNPNFRTSTFGNEARFGTIILDSPKHTASPSH